MTEEQPKPKKRSIMTTTQMVDPNVSVAKAIDSLTEKNLKVEMLSNISENDVPRLAVAITAGQDEDLDAWFLDSYAHNELALMCSVVMKRGGIRSEQITEISKAPPLLTGESEGFFAKVKNRLGR